MNFWVIYKRTSQQDREGWSRWPFYKNWHVLYGQPFSSAKEAQEYIDRHHRRRTLQTCVVAGESVWTRERVRRRFR